MEGKRIHYVIVLKKTGQPYIHSGSLATDDEDAVRKHYAARGQEVVLRTSDIREARRCEAQMQGRFRLKLPTIACSTADGKNEVLHVPANEEIRVIGNLHASDNHNRMVEIEWRGRRLQMFSVDILERSE